MKKNNTKQVKNHQMKIKEFRQTLQKILDLLSVEESRRFLARDKKGSRNFNLMVSDGEQLMSFVADKKNYEAVPRVIMLSFLLYTKTVYSTVKRQKIIERLKIH